MNNLRKAAQWFLSRWRFFSPTLGIALCCTSLLLLLKDKWEMGLQVDEAYIHYRYAANWLHGKGLVFNPGEYIEGMPSLLFAILVALGLGLGFDAVSVGHTLCLGFSFVTLGLTYFFAKYKLPAASAWFAGIAPLLVLASSCFALWSGSGMETLLWSSAILAALLATAKRRIGTATIASLVATLTHVEGLMVAVAVFIDALIKEKGIRGRTLLWLTVYLIGFCGLTLFRLVYYGSALPNWFYALGGFSLTTGLTALFNFLLSGPILLITPAIYAGAHQRTHDSALFYLGLSMFFLFAIGGDALDYSPLLTATLPILAVLAIHGCVIAWGNHRTLGISMTVSVTAAGVFQYFGSSSHLILYLVIISSIVAIFSRTRSDFYWRSSFFAGGLAVCTFILANPSSSTLSHLHTVQGRSSRQDRLAEIQNHLRIDSAKANHQISIFTKETTDPFIAVTKIGRIGYKTGYRIVDLLGRTEKAITGATIRTPPKKPVLFTYQHGDIKHVLLREPEYVVATDLVVDQYPAVKEAISNPEFNRLYDFDGVLYSYRRRSKPRLDPKEIEKRLSAPPKTFDPEARPNIVLLTIDTLRADHLEMHGYFRKTAPSISRLAKQGILFSNAYSTAPWTTPSLVSIFTSLYPSQHGIDQIEKSMSDAYKTITERLKEAGYTTIGLVSNLLSSRLRGFKQGFDHFDETQIVFIEVPTSKNLTRNALELLVANEREPFFFMGTLF